MTNDAPAELLRAIRSKLNLSQEQLAARLNVSFASVNRWEAGKSKPQRAQARAIEALSEEAGLASEDETQAPAESTRRHRRGIQKSSVLGNKGMEQMLWDAACSIRGEKDTPKFKDYTSDFSSLSASPTSSTTRFSGLESSLMIAT